MHPFLSRGIRLLGVLAVLAVIGAVTGVAVMKLPAFFWLAFGVLILLLLVWRRYQSVSAIRAFRRKFGPRKDFLLVYTESPHWQPYIEQRWISRWGERMVLFNRSRPWSNEQVEARLWQSIRWDREHTPLAIIIPPRGSPHAVELYSAFREFKHGKPQRLQAAEDRIQRALDRVVG
jgi:hypothetical protein